MDPACFGRIVDLKYEIGEALVEAVADEDLEPVGEERIAYPVKVAPQHVTGGDEARACGKKRRADADQLGKVVVVGLDQRNPAVRRQLEVIPLGTLIRIMDDQVSDPS